MVDRMLFVPRGPFPIQLDVPALQRHSAMYNNGPMAPSSMLSAANFEYLRQMTPRWSPPEIRA